MVGNRLMVCPSLFQQSLSTDLVTANLARLITTSQPEACDALSSVLGVELGKFDTPLWHAPYGRIV